MLNQYLCGIDKTDLAQRYHAVQIKVRNGEMQHVLASIDCGATSIFIVPSLCKGLEISDQAAHITTLSPDRGVKHHAKDSRRTRIKVQYLDYLAQDNDSGVVVILIREYNLVLALAYIHNRNPDIDWAHHPLTARLSPSASGVEEITPIPTVVASKVSEADNDKLLGCCPDI